MVVRAPESAKKIKPGQFIMLRIDEQGERIPLTMNDCDPEAGTITIIFQAVGATTMRLAQMKAGDALQDFAGPLGNPTELEGAKRACVIGGGLGTAIAFPQAKWLYDHGCEVDVITGFRNKDLVLLEDEINQHSTRQIIMTDDGSNGNKGLVTQALQQRIDEGADYDLVLAVGPVIMMKFVAATTKPYGIKTYVSMNPLMIDGTGMCGGCRVRGRPRLRRPSGGLRRRHASRRDVPELRGRGARRTLVRRACGRRAEGGLAWRGRTTR